MDKDLKKLIAGNWKMNGTADGVVELIQGIEDRLDDSLLACCDFLICPSFVHLVPALSKVDKLLVGAQDCSDMNDGAVTGQVSAAMLADLGVSHVILGHSECRQYRMESDALIARKGEKLFENGLHVILCVGETEGQRDCGDAMRVVKEQLFAGVPAGAQAKNLTIAYEPVWAIGTGKVASVDDIREMHDFIREELAELALDYENVRILYGGSMKPDNAKEILALINVNGGLIGGASLNAEDFINIGKAAF